MASPGGTCCSSSSLQNSGSEGDLQNDILEQKKRKRMLSNRESARRSRMRKQQHLDDLIAQVSQLKKENNQIITNMRTTSQMYLNIASENAILMAQMAELSNRLRSLNDIIDSINSINCLFDDVEETKIIDCSFMNPWNSVSMNQTIMASADMLMY